MKQEKKKIDGEEIDVPENKVVEKIDFDALITKVVKSNTYVSLETMKFVDEISLSKSLYLLFSEIMKKEDKYTTLFQLGPFHQEGRKDDRYIYLLAIMIQNAFHDKNAKRVKSIEEGKYHPIESVEAKISHSGILISERVVGGKNYLDGVVNKIMREKVNQYEAKIVEGL